MRCKVFGFDAKSRFSRNKAKVQGGVQEILFFVRFPTQFLDIPDFEMKKPIFYKKRQSTRRDADNSIFLCEV